VHVTNEAEVILIARCLADSLAPLLDRLQNAVLDPDMHRLLLYKGYMFPEVRREDAAVLNPSDVCGPTSMSGR
jgi:hypothetical protein